MTDNKGEQTKGVVMEKIKVILSGISVEPTFFLFIVVHMVYKMVVQNLYMEKACRVSLSMNSSICDAMSIRNQSGYTKSDEIVVQKLSSLLMAFATAFDGLFPVILALFMGSWSDRHNLRKPTILAPVLGLFLTMACLIVNSVFFQLPIIFTVLSDLFFVFGGSPCILLGVYSFVGATSSDENKTLRMGVVSTTHSIGMLLGIASSGFLYNYLGFIATFTLCATLLAVGILVGHFLIKDVPLEKSENAENYEVKQKKSFFFDFFDLRCLANTFKVCFKCNKNNRRYKVLAIMFLGFATGGPNSGEMAVSYLYSRYKYGWSVMEYSGFTFIHFISQSLAIFISVGVFSRWLKWEDATLGIIGIISSICGAMICAFANVGYLFILGGTVDCLMIGAHIALRTMLAKTVAPHELGQINSIFGVAQAFSHFVCSPLYNLLYRSTITIFPGAFYLLSVAIKSVGLCLFIFLYIETVKMRKLLAKSQKDDQVAMKTHC